MSSLENRLLSCMYPIVTVCLAVFVTYSGYCVYIKTKQASLRAQCTYELFEDRLIKILRRAASKKPKYLKPCQLSMPIDRRNYFMKKVETGNEHIKAGDQDKAVQCMIEAMAVCSRPAILLECMSKVLPVPVYMNLIEKLTELA